MAMVLQPCSGQPTQAIPTTPRKGGKSCCIHLHQEDGRSLRAVMELRAASMFPGLYPRVLPRLHWSADIKRHVENRLHLWEEGKFDAIIQDISSATLNGASRGATKDNKEQEA